MGVILNGFDMTRKQILFSGKDLNGNDVSNVNITKIMLKKANEESFARVFERIESLQEYQETVADGHWETGNRTVSQGYWATGTRTVSSGYYKTETYYESQQCRWYNTYSMSAKNAAGQCSHTSCWYSCNGFDHCDYWTNNCQAGSTSSFYTTIQVAKTRQVWVDTSYQQSYQYWVDTSYTESYQYWVDTSYQVTKFRTVISYF